MPAMVRSYEWSTHDHSISQNGRRRNKRIRWPISPTEKSAKLTPFRVIAPLDEKCTAYLAKKLTFATPGPTSRPLGSHATLYDYCKEVPLERNGRTFRQWATRHQIPPREAIQI